MLYKFTIVDQRTGRPITGEINFRWEGQKTIEGWPVPLEGIEMEDSLVESYDDIIVSSPGYGTYGAPVGGLHGETEFQLVKNVLVWPWVVGGVALALAMAAPFFKEINKR